VKENSELKKIVAESPAGEAGAGGGRLVFWAGSACPALGMDKSRK